MFLVVSTVHKYCILLYTFMKYIYIYIHVYGVFYFTTLNTRFLWTGEFNRGRFWPLTRTMASAVDAGKNKFNGIFSAALVSSINVL